MNHYIDEEENVVDGIEMRQPQTIWEMAKLLGRIDGTNVLYKDNNKARSQDKIKIKEKKQYWKPRNEENRKEFPSWEA